jgi:hypothetical protein
MGRHVAANIATQYIADTGVDFASLLSSDTAPDCVELMGEVAACCPTHGHTLEALWVDPLDRDGLRPACGLRGYTWGHHCAPLIDGLVHDAWHPELVLPPDEYCDAAFPEQLVAWEVLCVTGDDEKEGP